MEGVRSVGLGVSSALSLLGLLRLAHATGKLLPVGVESGWSGYTVSVVAESVGEAERLVAESVKAYSATLESLWASTVEKLGLPVEQRHVSPDGDALALIGWLEAAFKASTGAGLVVAYPAPRWRRLGYNETKVLYAVARRLAVYADLLGYSVAGEAEPALSHAGLAAYLAPAVRDVTGDGDTLSLMELVLYVMEHGSGGWRLAEYTAVPMHVYARVPDALVSALIARPGASRSLAAEAPDFYNLLGEYMLTGDESFYAEALEALAKVVASGRSRSPEAVEAAAEILGAVDRLGIYTAG